MLVFSPKPNALTYSAKVCIPICFAAKKTLYNNPDIKERIETLRYQQSQVPTPAQIKREMDENNKDALIASLKRKIKKLEEENKHLREQLKIAYSDVYEKFKNYLA